MLADDDEDPALQQALMESRQQSQAQQQGTDPSASSSAAGQRTTQEEILNEIQVGQNLEAEYQQLSQRMASSLTLDELERFRKVSQLQNENKQRVAELCERGMQESRDKQLEATRASFDKQKKAKSTGAPQGKVQQPQTTTAMLGSLQPLRPAKPSPQKIVKTAPDPSRVNPTAMAPPPVAIKTAPLAIGTKVSVDKAAEQPRPLFCFKNF